MSLPCSKTECKCPHTDCDYGMIEVTQTHITERTLRDGSKKQLEQVYLASTFCPTCDPERAHIIATSTSADERDKRLRENSHFKKSERYDNLEASRTRTL